MTKVLLIGQTPPPYVGQFIMIEKLASASYENIEVIHVDMSFSKNLNEIGRFSLRKFRILITVLVKVWYVKLSRRPEVIVYPPSGPNRIPVYRDIAFLLCTRWLFKRVVFHFHAGGVSEYEKELSRTGRALFRLAYYRADLSIRLAACNPQDGENMLAKSDVVIPYGIPDASIPAQEIKQSGDTPLRLLYVGMLRESKGLFVFLQACAIMKREGILFRATLVGGFPVSGEDVLAREFVAANELDDYVEFSGVLKGEEKWAAYRQADLFCMPSHYESETFGLVVVEAMQFSLPVVATNWRGLQSIVIDGETGFLVPIKRSDALAEKLKFLIRNESVRNKMAANARQRYLETYTEEIFHKTFENEILKIL